MPLVQLEINLCWKSNNPEMMKTISRKSLVKALEDNPLGKDLPRDKTLGLDPENHVYQIEEGDNTEEGENQTTLIITIQA